MDKRIRNTMALGLLTVVAVALFFWGLYFLLGSPLLRGEVDVVALMENGAGVRRGDPVQVQGVKVGSVNSVKLGPDQDVILRMRLDRGISLPVDTHAVVAGDVFGAHLVNLIPGKSLVRLQEHDTIQGATEPQLTQLAAHLGERAGKVLTNVDSLLSPRTLADLQATASVLPASARQLQDAFAQLHLAAAALRRTAEDAEKAKAADALVGALDEVQNSAAALTSAAQNMDRSLDSFSSLMAKLDQGQGTLGKLVNDSSLYVEMANTLREFRALATDIRERPKRYLDIRIF